MFPEYRELITQLKGKDTHFQKKFDEHNHIDEQIKNLEKSDASDFNPDVKTLKLKKLHLKEEIHQILKEHG